MIQFVSRNGYRIALLIKSRGLAQEQILHEKDGLLDLLIPYAYCNCMFRAKKTWKLNVTC